MFPVCLGGITISGEFVVSRKWHLIFFVFVSLRLDFCIGLTCRTLLSGYSRAEELCKEYRQTKGPGTTAKPSEQQFFLKLGGLIKNTLDKCQRENGFMWVRRVDRSSPIRRNWSHEWSNSERSSFGIYTLLFVWCQWSLSSHKYSDSPHLTVEVTPRMSLSPPGVC